MNNFLDIKKTNMGNIVPGSNVVFNIASPFSQGIEYDSVTGEIIFSEIGQYSIKWWVATETALTGCIQFALKSSQGDVLMGCSPTKRGQVIGFGDIDVRSANVTLSLVNMGTCQVILSKTAPVTADLLVIKIPEDGVIPTFAVDSVDTLEPGEDATADVQEDLYNPNNWLFSFGIPKGEPGVPGDTPHIDPDTGNWLIGDVDTGVQARGPEGPTGPTGPAAAIIPFCIGKYGLNLSTDAQGEPLMVAFSGFGNSYYDMATYLLEGEWATETITIRQDMNYSTAFIMPHNQILKKIHVLFSYGDSRYGVNTTIMPFVCLAVSNSDTLVYNILRDTMTFTEPYADGIDFPKHTIRKGSLTNLNVEIREGTLVAIVAGIMSENATQEQYATFSISGGLYLE